MKKLFLGLMIVLLSVSLVWATTIKDDMNFEGTVNFADIPTFNDAIKMIDVTITGVKNALTGVTEFTLPTLLDTGVIYTVDAASVGCSATTSMAMTGDTDIGVDIVFPAVSSTNDNKVFAVQKVGSGTSALVCWVDGTEFVGGVSGTTFYAGMDAVSDITWFRVDYSGATYWFVGGRIQ